MRYEYRPVHKKTAARLSSWCDVKNRDHIICETAGKAYEWNGKTQTWRRMIVVKDQPPEFRYLLIYGAFDGFKGGIFGIVRVPGEYKSALIESAIKRLLQNKGVRKSVEWYAESDDNGHIFKRGNYDNYVLEGTEFVAVQADDGCKMGGS